MTNEQEIERKFLVNIDYGTFRFDESKLLHNVYLATHPVEIRISKTKYHTPEGRPDLYKATYKIGSGLTRREISYTIEQTEAEMLMDTGGFEIKKTRHVVSTDNGRKWEIDDYFVDDRITDMVGCFQVAEIELQDENEELPPFPKGIEMICEVTSNLMFSNAWLAEHGIYKHVINGAVGLYNIIRKVI